MIRLLVYIALLVAIALGFTWLADRPGEVTLVWQGERIDTDLITVTIGLLVLMAAVVILLWVLGAVLKTPFAVGSFFQRRRRERGWRALSQGLIAAGAGDPSSTLRLARDARKILGNEPLALLLEAQSAQLGGDRAAARAAFEHMLETPETRLLGLRGLFVEAQRYGEATAARHFATEATRDAPKLAWAGQALLEFQAQASDWAGALETLDRNARNKILDRVQTKRLRAVLMTARALQIEQGEPDLARSLALEAHSLSPDLVPATVVAARLLTRQGDFKRAARVLEATWKLSPHPDVSDAYARVRPGDSTLDRLNRIKDLIRVRSHHTECAFAIANASLDARDFKAARTAMEPLLAAGPTRRACLLMADIEEAESNDEGRIREWLSRAVRAPRDATWVADGFVSDHWAPVSPVSGRLDAFEWIVPPEDVTALPMAITEAKAPEPAVIKTMTQIEPPASEPAPVQAEVAPVATAPAAPMDQLAPELKSATIVPIAPPPQSPSSGTATATVAQRVSKPVAFPLDHAPDDPGPAQPAAEDTRTDTRFRLFN